MSARVGVVGLGLIAQLVYLPLLRRRRDLFEVTALCDLSAELVSTVRERAVPGATTCTSLEELTTSEAVDAALLLTSGSHGEAARTLLEHGIPVLCEKPLAYTRREASALPDEPGLLLGYMKLHDVAVAEALAQIRTLGTPRSVEVTVLHPSPARQLDYLPVPFERVPLDPGIGAELRAADDRLRAEALGPAADELGALYTDVVLGSIIHDVYLVRHLVGPVGAIEHAATWPADAWPPSVAVEGVIGDGARLSIRWHYLEDQPTYRERVAVHLEGGSVELTFPTPYRLHAPTRLTTSAPWGAGERRSIAVDAREMFERQLEAFHGVVVDGERPQPSVAEGLEDIAVCQRIVRRLAEGRGLEVGGEAAEA